MNLREARSAREFLAEELGRRTRENPRYSQRAFARQLGLSAGELSEVMRDRRQLSLKSALKVSAALGLNAAETKHLLYLAQADKAQKLNQQGLPSEPTLEQRNLTLDMFHIVSDWYCFAILSLADCDDFQWNMGWIAKRLNISYAEARLALQRLERVGLIEKEKEGFKVSKDYVLSPTGIPSEAIRNYHRQILNKAIQALDLQNVEERELSGISFALDPKMLPSLKKEISDFQDHIVNQYSQAKGKKTQVYHLESALFRLSEK